MSRSRSDSDDDLADFDCTSFAARGKTRRVFRIGAGPAVIVISEMPGITPKVAEFARRIAASGLTAVVPHLFGEPGRDPATGRAGMVGYLASSFVPVCVSREFAVLATGRTSPVVSWLRALAGAEHDRCGGPGVGAIGMCFTGGFALAMATDPRLLVPVLAQPSLPLPIRSKARRTIDISPADLDVVRRRCTTEGLEVLGLRFRSDPLVPDERFAFLRQQLGDSFIAVELDDDAANPAARTKPHSVLTEHLIDDVGQPTRRALDDVLELLVRKLLGPHDISQ